MSSERLAPPKGYTSWLDYAIETMETRQLFLEVCWGESPWPDGTRRDDMRQAAKDELEELRLAASPKIKRDPFGYMEFSDGLAGCDGLMGYRESGQQGAHCNLCERDVPTCAVCEACRECHEEWAKKERFFHLGNLIATYEMECHAKIESVFDGMTDDDLRAFVEAEEKDPNHRYNKLPARLAQSTLGYRRCLRRADELGCDAYCPEHDCDTRNCPAGSHGDE